MPVTPTYPGLYLEELPSSARTITPSQTSVTAFVGYTHPYKTRRFDTAVLIFSFADYEREFGGLYASRAIDSTLAYAVNQFFLNGGGAAYVVGLETTYQGPGDGRPSATLPTQGGSVVFTAREPTDVLPMRVTVENARAATATDPDLADVTVTHGQVIESFRSVSLTPSSDRFIEKLLGSSVLVRVAAGAGGYGTAFPGNPASSGVNVAMPSGTFRAFNAGQFTAAFGVDTSLDKVTRFNLLCVPGVFDRTVVSSALAFAERKLAFMIVDPPANAAADLSTSLPAIETVAPGMPKSPNGALYFPYVRTTDPLTGELRALPPSGAVAGQYASTDFDFGVWKAPAGLATAIAGTSGVVEWGRMTDQRQGVLNGLGINCLREFPAAGTVVFGTRTLVTANPAFQQWRYIPVRRMALYIEQSLMDNLGWAIFEPNDRPLWTALRSTVDTFLLGLFTAGAFAGSTPSQAFRVVCDATTTTEADQNRGIVNIVVAFRPLMPAEFVVIKIAQLAGQA